MSLEVLVNRKPYLVRVLDRDGNFFLIEINKKIVKVLFKNTTKENVSIIEVNGDTFYAKLECPQRNLLKVRINGKPLVVEFPSKVSKRKAVTTTEPVFAVSKKSTIPSVLDKNAVTAPIAGKLVLWKVKNGQKVEKGECICVLEAMKMANEISAPKSGVLKEIRVYEGTVVNKGDVLAIIE